MRIFLFALIFLGLATRVGAQTNRVISEITLDEALSIEDMAQRVSALEVLLAQADDPEGKILLNYHIGQSYSSYSHFGSAIDPLKAALALNDRHTPDHIKRRETLATLLYNNLLKAGQRAEALDIAEDIVRRNDALLGDMWRRTDGGMIHRTTGLLCPHSFAGLIRTETSNFAPDGRDVGCSYKAFRDESNLLTIYFTYYGEGYDDPVAAHASATNMMEQAGSSEGAKLVGKAASAVFSVGGLPDVRETVYLRNSRDGHEYTGAWTSLIGGWVLKTRVTWAQSLGLDFGQSKSETAFQMASAGLASHMTTCQDQPWNQSDSNPNPQSDLTTSENGMSYILMEMLNQPSERPDIECMILGSEQGNAFIVGHPDSQRVYTIAGPAISGDVFLETSSNLVGLINNRDEQIYLLKSRHMSDGNEPAYVEVLKAYVGEPNPKTVFNDFVQIYNGHAQGYGRITMDADGKQNVTIYTQSGNETQED